MYALAVIPARMGSKRMPRKNELEIEPGLSLVQQAINCAVMSGMVDDVVVSTDDPFLNVRHARKMPRPDLLSGDAVDIGDVVEDVIRDMTHVTHVVVLQPAVLARSALIVRRMLEYANGHDIGGMVTVARTVPWQWSLKGVTAANAWHPGPYPRSQDSAHHFAEINAVQITTRPIAMRRERWELPLVYAELPPWTASLDIDTPSDLIDARDIWPWAKYRLETHVPQFYVTHSINGDRE